MRTTTTQTQQGRDSNRLDMLMSESKMARLKVVWFFSLAVICFSCFIESSLAFDHYDEFGSRGRPTVINRATPLDGISQEMFGDDLHQRHRRSALDTSTGNNSTTTTTSASYGFNVNNNITAKVSFICGL